MSIKHLNDLPVNDFVSIIENIEKVTITEKFDGSNLFCGRDKYGFYTKYKINGKHVYDINEYDINIPSNHYKIFGHTVLSEFERQRTFCMGDEFETEVLFGTRPNVIVYPDEYHNRIVFLRSVNGKVPLQSDEIVQLSRDILPENIPFSDIDPSVTLNSNILFTPSKFFTEQRDVIVDKLFDDYYIGGQLISIHDVMHWPLNKRYPNDKISLKGIKLSREILKSTINSRKKFLSDQIHSEITRTNNRQIEGLVLSYGNLTAKVAPIHIFLAKKNYIWAWREAARKNPNMVDDIEQQFDIFIKSGSKDIHPDYINSTERHNFTSEEYCDEVIRRTRLVFNEIRNRKNGR